MKGEERFLLVLAPAGGSWGEIPADVRLRRALRALGRSFGLRVVEVRQEDPCGPSPLYPRLNPPERVGRLPKDEKTYG